MHRVWTGICVCISMSLCVIAATAQQRDCRAIADPTERLRCFDQPLDCKSVTDPAERLKCFDAQSSAAPAGGAPSSPAAAAPAPAAPPEPIPPILKSEPPGGQLPHGVKVWVDDGSCPAGFIKEITGGNVSIGLARTRACVERRDKK